MNSPPAARPETQEARGANRGRQETSPNYVRIVNPISERVVKLKLALEWVTEGRAEWVTKGAEIRLIERHTANLDYAASVKGELTASDAGYDEIRSGFEWHGRQSDGATVMMTQRGPSPSHSVRSVRHFAGRSGPVRSIVITQ